VQTEVNAARTSAAHQNALGYGKCSYFKFFMVANRLIDKVAQVVEILDLSETGQHCGKKTPFCAR
jgi:hypothetical protein